MCDKLAVMYAGRVVEYGPVSQIFNDPVHPYTRALLNSIPRMTDPDQRLTAIEGQPPDLSALPPGCSFAPRCPNAIAALPRVRSRRNSRRSEGRSARCWLAEPVSRRSRAARRHKWSSVMAVIEAVGLTKHFRAHDGGMFGGGARDRARGGRHLVHDRARPDARHRRRVRLRQDDDRKARARPRKADRRHDAVRGPGSAAARRGRTARIPQIGAGRVSGPLRLAQPAHADQLDHRRAADHEREGDRRGGAQAGRRSCSIWSVCRRAPPICSRTNSRAVSASASRSPAPSR